MSRLRLRSGVLDSKSNVSRLSGFNDQLTIQIEFMAYLQPDKPEKVYLPAIRAAKEKGEKLSA